MARALFACSSCCLRRAICADSNPVLASGLGPGVTRMVDPSGFFPWGVVVVEAGRALARAAAAAAAAAVAVAGVLGRVLSAVASSSVFLVGTIFLVASFFFFDRIVGRLAVSLCLG